MTTPRVKVPGLVWIRRKKGLTPYWIARDSDRKAGFRPRSANLSRWANDPINLAERCDALGAEVLAWRSARPGNPLQFDGTIKSLSRLYQSHPQSQFQQLKAHTRRVYLHYLKRLEQEIGNRHIGEISGLDLKRWHQEWSSQGEHLAASRTCRSVLLAMVTFGIEARLHGCVELAATLKAANRSLPNPRRRDAVVSADEVVVLRAAAHAGDRPCSALAYALVFETTLRLWDVIGQWVPLTAEGVSDVTAYGKKWFGLRWEDIDDDLMLRYVPSKTSAKTGLGVTFPLSMAPMIMEELAHWPQPRTGPVIINHNDGLPFSGNYFSDGWRRDRVAAGLPASVWARDLRASGITEARAAGIATDDVAKVAGHASTKTTSAVYDRAVLEAAERFAEARIGYRATKQE